MLATARLLGMTLGATIVALIFHLAPEGAEPIGLRSAPASPSRPGVVSGLRLSRRATVRRGGEGLSRPGCWQGR